MGSPWWPLVSRSAQSLKYSIWRSENIAPPAPPSVCSLSRNARISNFMVKMKMLLYTVQQVIANMIETLLVKTLHKLNVFTFFSFFVSVSVSPYQFLVFFSVLQFNSDFIELRGFCHQIKRLISQLNSWTFFTCRDRDGEVASILVCACKNIYAVWNLKFQQQVSIVRGLRKCKNVLQRDLVTCPPPHRQLRISSVSFSCSHLEFSHFAQQFQI